MIQKKESTGWKGSQDFLDGFHILSFIGQKLLSGSELEFCVILGIFDDHFYNCKTFQIILLVKIDVGACLPSFFSLTFFLEASLRKWSVNSFK